MLFEQLIPSIIPQHKAECFDFSDTHLQGPTRKEQLNQSQRVLNTSNLSQEMFLMKANPQESDLASCYYSDDNPIVLDQVYHLTDNDFVASQDYSSYPELAPTSTAPSSNMNSVHPSIKNMLLVLQRENPSQLATLTSFLKTIKPPTTSSSEDKNISDEMQSAFEKCVSGLKNHGDHALPFLKAVNKKEAPNYYDVILKPMDLATVMKKVKGGAYRTKKEFTSDLELIWNNCLQYNTHQESPYRVHAHAMRRKMMELLKKVPEFQQKSITIVTDEEEPVIELKSDSCLVPEETTGASRQSINKVAEILPVTLNTSKYLEHIHTQMYNDIVLPLRIHYLRNITLPPQRIGVASQLYYESESAYLNRIQQYAHLDFTSPSQQASSELTHLDCFIPETAHTNGAYPMLYSPVAKVSEKVKPAQSKLVDKMKTSITFLHSIKNTHAKILARQNDINESHLQPSFTVKSSEPASGTVFDETRKSIAFLLLHAGFDALHTSCLDFLQDVFVTFQKKLAHALTTCERSAHGIASTFQKNGSSILSLHKHMRDVHKHVSRLQDVNTKLIAHYTFSNTAKGLEEDTLLSGNLWKDIGVDFLGLKECGIDLECVPMSLWNRKINSGDQDISLVDGFINGNEVFEEMREWTTIERDSQIKLLQAFYDRKYALQDMTEDDNLDKVTKSKHPNTLKQAQIGRKRGAEEYKKPKTVKRKADKLKSNTAVLGLVVKKKSKKDSPLNDW